MTKTLKGVVGVALLIAVATPVLACGALWVSIQSGESRLFGAFKPFYPVTASIPCGESVELVISENSTKFVRRSGSIQAEFNGANLILMVGLRPYQIPIPPNGTPVQIGLDDGQLFRGGVVLTAIQDIASR